jgi:hypothetical protein
LQVGVQGGLFFIESRLAADPRCWAAMEPLAVDRGAVLVLALVLTPACSRPADRSKAAAASRPDHVHHYDRLTPPPTLPPTASPTPEPPSTSLCKDRNRDDECILWVPRLSDVIAQPATWNGRRIRTQGFLVFEFEGDALYVARQDREGYRPERAVFLRVSDDARIWRPHKKRPNWRMGDVEGTFQAGDHGHMGLYGGAIVDVTRIR